MMLSPRPAIAFARRGARLEFASQPHYVQGCQASFSRQHDAFEVEVPRRFRPRLAAGFGDEPGDGLRSFDVTTPRWLAEIPIGSVAMILGLVVTSVAVLALFR